VGRENRLCGTSRSALSFECAYQVFEQENIPAQFRTISGIARFALALLSEKPIADPQQTRIQAISLPAHHQDKPGDQPTCKGFAIIVLASKDDAENLQTEWPWSRTALKESKIDTASRSAEFQEAAKFGFRTLSKVRWEELREEYLAFRSRLVEEINASEDAGPMVAVPSVPQLAPQQDQYAPLSKDPPIEPNYSTVNLASPYPTNSLIFVRNIHPETNKTTLHKFFATAYQESLDSGEIQNDGLDYIDFSKGMDSVSQKSV
jgi:hypothetical protein